MSFLVREAVKRIAEAVVIAVATHLAVSAIDRRLARDDDEDERSG